MERNIYICYLVLIFCALWPPVMAEYSHNIINTRKNAQLIPFTARKQKLSTKSLPHLHRPWNHLDKKLLIVPRRKILAHRIPATSQHTTTLIIYEDDNIPRLEVRREYIHPHTLLPRTSDSPRVTPYHLREVHQLNRVRPRTVIVPRPFVGAPRLSHPCDATVILVGGDIFPVGAVLDIYVSWLLVPAIREGTNRVAPFALVCVCLGEVGEHRVPG